MMMSGRAARAVVRYIHVLLNTAIIHLLPGLDHGEEPPG